MFIEKLKADIERGYGFDWQTDNTLIFTAERMTRRAVSPQDVERRFEKFFQDTVLHASIETLTRAQFEAARDQPLSTDARKMRPQWFEFLDALPGLEEWQGCLIALLPDPRKAFGKTADNRRPPGICCVILCGENDIFAVSYVDLLDGLITSARIKQVNLSDQAVISGTSLSQKQQEAEKFETLWKVLLALQ